MYRKSFQGKCLHKRQDPQKKGGAVKRLGDAAVTAEAKREG